MEVILPIKYAFKHYKENIPNEICKNRNDATVYEYFQYDEDIFSSYYFLIS